jgi:hypothetical protein
MMMHQQLQLTQQKLKHQKKPEQRNLKLNKNLWLKRKILKAIVIQHSSHMQSFQIQYTHTTLKTLIQLLDQK